MIHTMKFKIEKNNHPNLKSYDIEDLKIARTFTKKVYDEFGDYLMGVILFGSTARKTQTEFSDIDILLILDDLSINLSPEVVEAYRIITEKAIIDTSKRLHVVTMRFTAFWEYVRNGDPVGINILRDGLPLVDTGFFNPLQIMLRQGRIRPTLESIYIYLDRAPKTLLNSNWHIMQGVLDLYWAIIDSAHAALMRLGEIPASPEHVADMIEEKMVKPGLIEEKYAKIMRNFYDLQKMITYRRIETIKGVAYDRYRVDAEDFVDRMKKFVG